MRVDETFKILGGNNGKTRRALRMAWESHEARQEIISACNGDSAEDKFIFPNSPNSSNPNQRKTHERKLAEI